MKKICLSLLLIYLIVCHSTVFAQTDTTENIIDVQLNQCLDSAQNSTTYGTTGCQVRARDAWDSALNKYYNLLIKTLSKDEKEKLKAAQKKWLAFRDSEAMFSSTIYSNMQGTMWGIAKVQSDAALIKHRALELQAYYSDKAPK